MDDHHVKTDAAVTTANNQQNAAAPHIAAEPLSDLAVAAQYADAEMQSVVAQFENAAVVSDHVASSASAPAPPADDVMDESSDESADEQEDTKPKVEVAAAEDSSSDSDSDVEDEEDRAKLRADIEAAMEKEDAKSDGPLKTANEVAALPVQEPSVELTADCPIEQCGSILNVSVPGLMMTIKSNPNVKPLEEGSVLCLEDRTVLGCVDEVFGPVLMPMYLIRYDNSAKMPEKATMDTAVFYPTEHVKYIVPENIKDKGTDASNIFDEEADDADFSDDEAEAAAKRNRKRNRGGTHSAHTGGEGSNYSASSGGRGGRSSRGGGRGGNFSDYHSVQAASSGQGASFEGGRGSYSQHQPVMQTQPYGGATKYTQPQGAGGYSAPRAPMTFGNTNYTSPQNYGAPQPPMTYGNTNYTSPQNYGAPQPLMPSYNPMVMPRPGQQMQGQSYYQPRPPYSAHNLPPYPPQAPLPAHQTPYQQQLPSGHYGQQQQQQPRGPYDQRRY